MSDPKGFDIFKIKSPDLLLFYLEFQQSKVPVLTLAIKYS